MSGVRNYAVILTEACNDQRTNDGTGLFHSELKFVQTHYHGWSWKRGLLHNSPASKFACER